MVGIARPEHWSSTTFLKDVREPRDSAELNILGSVNCIDAYKTKEPLTQPGQALSVIGRNPGLATPT